MQRLKCMEYNVLNLKVYAYNTFICIEYNVRIQYTEFHA